MAKEKKEKYWSLKIPINLSKIDKEMKEYLIVCEQKLGMVPNILKTNTINKKKFDAFNNFYNRLMQEENFLMKFEKEMIAVVGMANETNRLVESYQVEVDDFLK